LHAGLHHLLLWGHHSRLHAWLHHLLLGWHHTWLHHARLHTWLHTWLHHTWLHAWLHAWLHHLLLGGTWLTLSSRCSWLPNGFQVDLSRLLASVGNLEPVIDATIDAEGGEFDGSLTNQIIRAWVLVVDLDGQVITDILHIDVECLVPHRRLACAILDRGLEILLTRRDLHVGVHLAEGLRVTSEPRFDHCQSERTMRCHVCIYKFKNLLLIYIC